MAAWGVLSPPSGPARRIAAAAYAARGMELPFSMGLRPRLSADAAFAAYSNPGLAPGDYSINPVRLQCCDFGESGPQLNPFPPAVL